MHSDASAILHALPSDDPVRLIYFLGFVAIRSATNGYANDRKETKCHHKWHPFSIFATMCGVAFVFVVITAGVATRRIVV